MERMGVGGENKTFLEVSNDEVVPIQLVPTDTAGGEKRRWDCAGIEGLALSRPSYGASYRNTRLSGVSHL